MRVTHLSIVHKPLDTRIFRKECRALAQAGYDVHLVVGGAPARQLEGVRLHSIAADSTRPRARFQLIRLFRAMRVAGSLRSSLYHLHDPHLIPLGVALKAAGAQVVYDVHEDYPSHARSKLVGRPLRRAGKVMLWRMLEWVARRTLDGFVCASPTLAAKFPPDRTVVVGNLPLQDEFGGPALPYRERANTIVCTGYITKIRAFWEIARALELLPVELDCRLRVIGVFRPVKLARRAAEREAWRRIEELGWQPHPTVVRELLSAKIGLVLLHPLPNHTDAIRSNKLFEYMAAGIPVLASDFPRWREIVCGLGCGMVVDPRDPRAIAAAVEHLLRHPDEAEEMGARGRAAVAEQFNWDAERERLLSLYRDLIGSPVPAPVADLESALSA